MSYYDDRRPATRDRRRGDDEYYDDTVYTNTRDNLRSTAVIKRRSDSPEYDEEIRRDFSPGGGGYYRETTIRKSGTRPAGRARSYEDDRRYDDDRSLASSRRDSYYGAKRRGYDDRLRGGRSRRDNYSDDSSRSRSRSRAPKRERRKSMPEEALAALGLGGLVAKLTGKSRSRSSSRDRDGRARSRSGRDRSGSEHKKEQLQQALKAAVLAGAGAAFRARHEEGGWNGEKGKRVLTAALTAGGVDGFINRDKDPEKHKFRDTIGAAVAGIATDRLVHGPRSRSRGPDGRRISPDRGSRSRSRSKARDLLAGGTAAIAAKKIMDTVRGRSQSRGRDRGRSRSRSRSYDSRDDSRSPPRRSRSRSVIATGLSKLGLDKQADKVDPVGARERSRSRGPGRNRNSSRSRYADDDYVDDHDRRSPYDPPNYGRGSMYDNRDVSKNPNPSSRSYSHSRALDPDSGALINRPHSVGPGGGVLSPPGEDYAYDTGPRHNGDPETDSDSDLGSSSDDENMKKKSRKRLAISGGLATVATIHAGRSVYQSMEKRKARKQALKNGTIDKEEAAKHKSRDRLQDAASIGLATLGLKGAYSEWKEMKDQNDEWNEELEKRKRHAQKREARRQKMSLVGMSHGEAGSSAPTFTEPYYGGGGPHEQFGHRHGHGQGGQPRYDGRGPPYMSGANGGWMGQQGQGPTNETNNNNMQYYDDNPYGWIGRQGNAEQQQGYNDAGGGPHYGNGTGNPNYPPPPAHGGTGFPPPPGSQPPPPQTR